MTVSTLTGVKLPGELRAVRGDAMSPEPATPSWRNRKAK
jgi:hypothetical protein